MSNVGEFRQSPVVAEFVDKFGDKRVVHRTKGEASRLSVRRQGNTVVHALNRAVAKLSAAKIKNRRLELGLSQRQVCIRAGFVDVNPKQRMHDLENASRGEGMRFGTLFALARALDCAPCDLLPTMQEAMKIAGVGVSELPTSLDVGV